MGTPRNITHTQDTTVYIKAPHHGYTSRHGVHTTHYQNIAWIQINMTCTYEVHHHPFTAHYAPLVLDDMSDNK